MTEAFDVAWNVAKMPIEMVDGAEQHISRGLIANEVWQGRRAGQPDTGYWTPHKDKAVAYAMYGPRFGYDWGGGVDASKEIPELWSYAPKGYEQWPADNEYVFDGKEGLGMAHERRRIAFKRDAEWDPETRSFHHNYPYNEPERMTKVPDTDLADIMERIMARENKDDNRRHPPEIIGEKEWGEVFGADLSDEDGIGWDSEELYYDMETYEPEREDIEWDLTTNDFPLAEGSSIQDYVDALRRRGQ